MSNTSANESGRDVQYNSFAGYAQAAYRLNAFKQRLKPYARYEQAVVDEADPALRFDESYSAGLGGLRVDVHAQWALKFETRARFEALRAPQWSGALQVSAAW